MNACPVCGSLDVTVEVQTFTVYGMGRISVDLKPNPDFFVSAAGMRAGDWPTIFYGSGSSITTGRADTFLETFPI